MKRSKRAGVSVPKGATRRVLGLVVLSCVIAIAGAAVAERPNLLPGENNTGPGYPQAGPTLPTQDLASGVTPTDMVNALLGGGVTVSNVVYTGDNSAGGTFSGGTGIIGFEDGIVLSSGNIALVAGPDNLADNTTQANGTAGDADLESLIPGFPTFDAAVLEFDFECDAVDVIQFEYVFTSEEYNEWVFSSFNDVFGFFLNGVNIALVPGGGGIPVAIDTVNCDNPYNPPAGGANCNLYRNNDCSDIPPNTYPCTNILTEMDGLTVVFTATGSVNPGVNHIKLAIADAGDEALDSNVFLRGASFVCAIPTGACCDIFVFTCQNDVTEDQCQGIYDVWSVGLACNQLDPPCIEPTGACCDDATGVCTNDVSQSACDGAGNRYGGDGSTCVTINPPCVAPPVCGDNVVNQGSEECDGTDDAACPGQCLGDCTCPLPTGACCDDATGVCVNDVTQADCNGRYGGDGSTCATINPPCLAPPICGDNVVNQASEECDGSDDGDCPGECQADCTCPPDVDPIPTVSQWGLAVLAIVLLIGAKVYFGRRERTA